NTYTSQNFTYIIDNNRDVIITKKDTNKSITISQLWHTNENIPNLSKLINLSYGYEAPYSNISSYSTDTTIGNDGDDYLKGADKVYGLEGDDYIYGTGNTNLLVGGSGSDHIFGGDGIDYLYGGADDDYLYGGDDADKLDGGDGFDTYYASNEDIIVDSDKKGRIYFNGILLSGTKRITGVNTYEDDDFTYTRLDENIIIAKKNSTESITIQSSSHDKFLDISLE
ncbi:MAG: Ca2+-binding RTX toxin-like protein, partial [Arcobacteraceae bacterium]